jgi:hypothetical protein
MTALDVVHGFDKEAMLMPTTNEETTVEVDSEFRIVNKDGRCKQRTQFVRGPIRRLETSTVQGL